MEISTGKQYNRRAFLAGKQSKVFAIGTPPVLSWEEPWYKHAKQGKRICLESSYNSAS